MDKDGNIIDNNIENCNQKFIDSECLNENKNNLVNLNIIKDELAKIPLNPETRIFYDNCIIPLLKTLESLSYCSENYSSAARNLAGVNVSSNSKIKNAVELVYNINKVSEDVFELLEDKIDTLLKYAKCCK